MTPADLDLDPDERTMRELIAWVRRECDELETILPAAISAQWSPAPVARPRVDTAERSIGMRSDPTQTVALDDQRLALRTQVVVSMRVIRRAIVAVRGVRRGLVMALDAWSGEEK